MPDDTIEARARRAAEEIRKNFCVPFRTFSREEHRMLTERRTFDITAIIMREMEGIQSMAFRLACIEVDYRLGTCPYDLYDWCICTDDPRAVCEEDTLACWMRYFEAKAALADVKGKEGPSN